MFDGFVNSLCVMYCYIEYKKYYIISCYFVHKCCNSIVYKIFLKKKPPIITRYATTTPAVSADPTPIVTRNNSNMRIFFSII